MLDVEVGLLPRQVLRHVHLLQPGLAALPAEADEEIRGRSERVGHALDQVAAAVAVEVDRVFEIVRGGELHAAELAGPVRRPCRRHAWSPRCDDAQRVHQLRAEVVAAPAVIGERRQRRQDLEFAEIAAEVALQAPEGGDDRRRHAVFLLDLAEQRGVLLHLLLAVRDAIAADHAVGELQEGLVEHRLAMVAPDDVRIEESSGEASVDHLRRRCPAPAHLS